MTTAKTQSPAAAIPVRSGFQPIPTRIRDVRDVPPLVVEPVNEAVKAEISGNLQELGIRLAGVHRAAAEAWLAQCSYDNALPHLEAAATFAPGELEYHNQIGFVRYITGDDTGAITAFNTVLATDPVNAEAWFNLGMVLYGQEQYADAEDCFRRSIETRNNDSQTWNNRGVCLFQTGRAAEAKTCFENALKIDPSDSDARHNLINLR
jgi:Flp pilus assembly protein TadD